MVDEISFRVASKSTVDKFYTVTVGGEIAQFRCNCRGFEAGYCSHGDAVLFSKETNMVPDSDIAAAQMAIALVDGKIAHPPNWSASWKKDMRWRGITRAGNRRVASRRTSGNPLVCFTGKLPVSRQQMIDSAKDAKWDVTDEPSPFTDVLVAADPNGQSAKLKKARQCGTVIVTCEEWPIIMITGELPSKV